jgi:hypothetical protein
MIATPRHDKKKSLAGLSHSAATCPCAHARSGGDNAFLEACRTLVEVIPTYAGKREKSAMLLGHASGRARKLIQEEAATRDARSADPLLRAAKWNLAKAGHRRGG